MLGTEKIMNKRGTKGSFEHLIKGSNFSGFKTSKIHQITLYVFFIQNWILCIYNYWIISAQFYLQQPTRCTLYCKVKTLQSHRENVNNQVFSSKLKRNRSRMKNELRLRPQVKVTVVLNRTSRAPQLVFVSSVNMSGLWGGIWSHPCCTCEI